MDNFELTPSTKLDENSGVIGLDLYLKSLERYYFSEVSLRSYTSSDGTLEMTIDMNCQMELLEVLEFHNKSRWGFNSAGISPLKESFDILTEQNNIKLDIEELTLFLNDTSIIIEKIHYRSIPELLDEIIYEIANHYVYLTKGFTEKPYEIFIPVFEDNVSHNTTNSGALIENKQKTPKSYFEFWGVYLESEHDAFIYDLNINTYISADLELYMIED
jgi:hypothetical protein